MDDDKLLLDYMIERFPDVRYTKKDFEMARGTLGFAIYKSNVACGILLTEIEYELNKSLFYRLYVKFYNKFLK